MPQLEILLAFGVAVLVMQLTPGPDMMLIVGRGIGQGRKVALCIVLGMTLLAGSVQLPLLALGVASLLQSSAFALSMLQWAGACYLIWLGGRLLWTSTRTPIAASMPSQVSAWSAMREGAINNLTNPKPLLFMFAFLPQFVDPTQGPVWMQLLALGLVQKLCGVVILSSVAFASGAVGGWLARRPGIVAWQERFTGVVMVALGIRLLLGGDARLARG
jgi:threonine/homoserine/homoserine lactone efflux protein